MATAIFMPKQGMSMEEGTLIRWLKNVGDEVKLNEPIMEIETDKIAMEAESPASGVILALISKENDVVPVLETMGWIGERGEAIPECGKCEVSSSSDVTADSSSCANSSVSATSSVPATPYAKKLANESGIDLKDVKGSGKGGEVYAKDVKASPVAKRMADATGVDISSVEGTGFNGKVMKGDVEKALYSTKKKHTETRSRLPGMRKVIAERMLKSSNEIPAAVIMRSADVTELMALRQRANDGKEKEDKLTINDFVLKAVAKSLAETSEFRVRLEGNELVSLNYVNLGCAVSVDGGLLVPVIVDADEMTITDIHLKVKDFASRAKCGKLLPDELTGSCFSVSNLGSYGVEFSTPIINQPDSGILGVGGVKDELFLKDDGTVGTRKMMGLSLSFDHRLVDGVPAAMFLAKIKAYLENPVTILL